MFPKRMFPSTYFPGTYFPPVTGGAPPKPRFGHWRPQPIPPGWPIDLDDEELLFWIL